MLMLLMIPCDLRVQFFFKCTKILSQCNLFVYYLLSFFNHVKTHFCTIMMESKNCSGLKYGTYEIFDIF